MPERVEIVRGLVMPFYPMYPTEGTRLRSKASVTRLLKDTVQGHWIMQPNLSGDRACLGVRDGKVHIQDGHGAWYRPRVGNAEAFLRLGEGVVLDGIVIEGAFHPFEMLAYQGKSMLRASASEREVLAFSLVRLLGQPWQFNKPSQSWLENKAKHGSRFSGVVMKKSVSPYSLASAPGQTSLHWFNHGW